MRGRTGEEETVRKVDSLFQETGTTDRKVGEEHRMDLTQRLLLDNAPLSRMCDHPFQSRSEAMASLGQVCQMLTDHSFINPNSITEESACVACACVKAHQLLFIQWEKKPALWLPA